MNKAQVKTLVKQAEAFCHENGIRFTEPRRLVLSIIAGADKPLGAYDILERMTSSDAAAKPPTAYRALDFLAAHGFVHRIESLNAYIVCGTDHRHQGSQFMVCDSCGDVEEAHLCDVPADLRKRTEKAGFRLSRWDAEIHGTCRTCAGGAKGQDAS